jgi:hypothetical protein
MVLFYEEQFSRLRIFQIDYGISNTVEFELKLLRKGVLKRPSIQRKIFGLEIRNL